MKSLTYIIKGFTLCVCAACLFIACNDDDSSHEYEDEEDLIEDNQDSINYELLVDAIAPYDTTMTVPERVVTMGRCLYPEHPDEYYTIADSYEEAKEHFMNVIFSEAMRSNLTSDNDVLTLSVLDATVSLQPASNNGIVAELHIDIPELALIKTLYYVQDAAWPSNDSQSPFQEMEIVRDPSGNYYFCVQNCKGGNGILITPNVVYEDWYRKKDHWQGQFYIYMHCASSSAFERLGRAVKYEKNLLTSTVEEFEDIITNQSIISQSKAEQLLNLIKDFLYKKDVKYMIGSPGWDTQLYWWYYYYIVWFDYYRCSDLSKQYYKTGGHNDVPPRYKGTSQVSFDYNFDRGNWTTIVL